MTSQGHGDVPGHGQNNLPLHHGGERQPPPMPPYATPPQSLHPFRAPPCNRAPPRRVDHTYREYSDFPLNEIPAEKKTLTNFPNKLHQILSTPAFSHILSWMPHGRAWKVHNKELLIREVISKFFAQSKYESFTRQLNGWGFKRLHQSGNDFNAYYHQCFLRGLPHLTALMKRVQPNKGKLLPHVEGEPNFYEIEKQFPLPPPMSAHNYGHYYQSTPHMENPGYGAPPLRELPGARLEQPVGYCSPFPPYRNTYPTPPSSYGHQDDHHTGAYQPYSYFPTQYSHPPPQHHYYPHYGPPGPQYSTLAHSENPPPNYKGSEKSEEVHLAPDSQYGTLARNENPPLNYNGSEKTEVHSAPVAQYGFLACDDNPPPNCKAPEKSEEVHLAPDTRYGSENPLPNHKILEKSEEVHLAPGSRCGTLARNENPQPKYSSEKEEGVHLAPGPRRGLYLACDENPPPKFKGPDKNEKDHLAPSTQGEVGEERANFNIPGKEDSIELQSTFAAQSKENATENDLGKEW